MTWVWSRGATDNDSALLTLAVQADALAHSDAGDPLPEVAIAVLPEHRARGIGTQMLTALDRAAAAGGQRALSLTVNALNPALHLYERAGFDVVLREGDRVTMVSCSSRRVQTPPRFH